MLALPVSGLRQPTGAGPVSLLLLSYICPSSALHNTFSDCSGPLQSGGYYRQHTVAVPNFLLLPLFFLFRWGLRFLRQWAICTLVPLICHFLTICVHYFFTEI